MLISMCCMFVCLMIVMCVVLVFDVCLIGWFCSWWFVYLIVCRYVFDVMLMLNILVFICVWFISGISCSRLMLCWLLSS